MKSVLVIGLGRFGRHLAQRMQDLGNDVMVVDLHEDNITPYAHIFTDSQIGDCTKEAVVKALGVENFDICFVTIGENFEASLIITSHLKKSGAKMVIAKANQEIQADLLYKIGADEVIYPEREMAEKVAVRYTAKNIFDYVPLTADYSIYEIPILPQWAGQTILELNVRRKYHINIIAVKNENAMSPMPSADYTFCAGDHVVVMGKAEDVFKLSAKT